METELTLIRPLTWLEILELWEQNEASMPKWIEHYQKRGFSSWKEWRSHSMSPLRPERLTWRLYEINDPLQTVPQFFGGPFRAWIKNVYDEKKIERFSEIAKDPSTLMRETSSGILENFPAHTFLVGLQTSDGVVVVEGMHRCTALAIAQSEGAPLKTQVQIALADFSDRIPLLGQEASPT